MNLANLMDEVAGVLAEITGLRTFGFPPPTITGTTGWVGYAQSIAYGETYGAQHGATGIDDLPIAIAIPKPTEKSSRESASKWASFGPNGVKVRMEEHRWVSCDDLTVGSVEFDAWDVAGVPYLILMFHATVQGQGGQ